MAVHNLKNYEKNESLYTSLTLVRKENNYTIAIFFSLYYTLKKYNYYLKL